MVVRVYCTDVRAHAYERDCERKQKTVKGGDG